MLDALTEYSALTPVRGTEPSPNLKRHLAALETRIRADEAWLNRQPLRRKLDSDPNLTHASHSEAEVPYRTQRTP